VNERAEDGWKCVSDDPIGIESGLISGPSSLRAGGKRTKNTARMKKDKRRIEGKNKGRNIRENSCAMRFNLEDEMKR
jgi:hypothetical protein